MLDIDRDRQRISLGLKQTQEDPWQRVVDTYNIGDELEGTVTKVVTFGAFVEILDGVEGLVHISELAQHHVENPREIIQPGDPVRVKILEIDSERRRLSLSIKRVEGQVLPVRPIVPPTEGDAGDLDDVPELGLSEDVFARGASIRPRRRRRRRRLRTRRRERPREAEDPGGRGGAADDERRGCGRCEDEPARRRRTSRARPAGGRGGGRRRLAAEPRLPRRLPEARPRRARAAELEAERRAEPRSPRTSRPERSRSSG